MSIFNKKRYRTDYDIKNDPRPNDELEIAYRQTLIDEAVATLEQRLTSKNGAKFCTDVAFALAGKLLAKTKKDISTDAI